MVAWCGDDGDDGDVDDRMAIMKTNTLSVITFKFLEIIKKISITWKLK